jgi:hypothetical protein
VPSFQGLGKPHDSLAKCLLPLLLTLLPPPVLPLLLLLLNAASPGLQLSSSCLVNVATTDWPA